MTNRSPSRADLLPGAGFPLRCRVMSAPEGYFLCRPREPGADPEASVPGEQSLGRHPSISDRGLGCAYACVRWAIPVGIVFWALLALVLWVTA